MDSNTINKNSWNKQSKQYQSKADFTFDNVDYGDLRYKTERDLKLIGDVKGKKVLELGCGGANCGIALAKQGAIVTCTDISDEQIKAAKENVAGFGVQLQQAIFECGKPLSHLNYLPLSGMMDMCRNLLLRKEVNDDTSTNRTAYYL